MQTGSGLRRIDDGYALIDSQVAREREREIDRVREWVRERERETEIVLVVVSNSWTERRCGYFCNHILKNFLKFNKYLWVDNAKAKHTHTHTHTHRHTHMTHISAHHKTHTQAGCLVELNRLRIRVGDENKDQSQGKATSCKHVARQSHFLVYICIYVWCTPLSYTVRQVMRIIHIYLLHFLIIRWRTTPTLNSPTVTQSH